MADPEIRKKVNEANIGKKQFPETIAKRVEKLKKGQKRPPFSEEWRKKINEGVKNLFNDPEYRGKMSEAHKGKTRGSERIYHLNGRYHPVRHSPGYQHRDERISGRGIF